MKFTSKLLYLAHGINKTLKNWSLALKKAIQALKLEKALKTGVVAFQFIKGDGSTRKAVGTRNGAYIPSEKSPKGSAVISKPFTSIRYFDQGKNGWRSFRADRLVA